MSKFECSVVIPTFNRASTLPRAIDSVLNQSLQPQEIIVVDDGSTDNTTSVIEHYGDKVTYISQGNAGASAARNRGVRQARCRWIAFHDSDDCWLSHKLQTIANHIDQLPPEDNHAVKLIFSSFTRYDASSHRCELIPKHALTDKQAELMLSPIVELELTRRNCIGTPAMLVDRELFLSSGGFDENLPSLEDWEFVIRLAQQTPFLYIPEPLVIAFAQTGSVNTVVSAAKIAKIKIRDRHASVFMRYGKRRLLSRFRRSQS